MPITFSVGELVTAAKLNSAVARELAEANFTANASVTATTEATANTLVTAAAVTLDGSTSLWITFSAPYATRGTTFLRFYLFDSSTSLGFIGHMDHANGAMVYVRRKLTNPSAGAHTYSIRASVDAGTGTVNAGTAGAGNYVPATMTIERA